MKLRPTSIAERDLLKVAGDTGRLFGPLQAARYKSVVERAMQLLLEDPLRATSRERNECGRGVRSFHLQLAAGRKGAASDVLFYAVLGNDLLIVRVLSDAMEPGSKIAKTLAAERRDRSGQ